MVFVWRLDNQQLGTTLDTGGHLAVRGLVKAPNQIRSKVLGPFLPSMQVGHEC
jgi:hypothetical protein